MENTLELIEANPIEQQLIKGNITEQVIAELQKHKTIVIKGIDDKEGYELANKARIACKNTRVLAEKICKEGREDSIKIQKAWIAKEKEVTGKISEVEDYLKAEQARIDTEKENIRMAAEKAAAERIQARVKALFDNGCTYDGVNYSIGETTINDTQLKVMDDNIFEPFIERVKTEHARELQMKELQEQERLAELERIEQAKKDEEARIKAEREALEKEQAAFREEQEKIKAENDRIAAEQKAKEDEIRKQQESIRIEKEKAEREEREKAIAIENERIEKERKELKAEADRLAAIEAENKRIAEQKEREEAERIESERQAALAPDKDKLNTFAVMLSELVLPEMSTDAGKAILDEVVILLQKTTAHITKKVKSL